MIIRALRATTSLDDVFLGAFDFSPGLTYLQLSLRSFMDRRIGRSFTVNFAADNAASPWVITRDAWINLAESRLFISVLPYLYGKTSEWTLQANVSELAYRNQEQLAEITKIEDDIRRGIYQMPIIKIFEDTFQKFEKNQGDAQALIDFGEDLRVTFDYLEKNGGEELGEAQLDFRRRIEVGSQLAELKKVRDEFQTRLTRIQQESR